jgi:hypothetical protein
MAGFTRLDSFPVNESERLRGGMGHVTPLTTVRTLQIARHAMAAPGGVSQRRIDAALRREIGHDGIEHRKARRRHTQATLIRRFHKAVLRKIRDPLG